MENRGSTCCFTGHRPEKLPWGDNELDPRCVRLKVRLGDALEAAYGEGMRHFICGMARGCDLYFGEAVVELQKRHPEVTLEAAIPCRDQTRGWSQRDKGRWLRLADSANKQTVLQERYSSSCMMQRNRYMVDHSALVITVYDGAPGGTRRTLEYAISRQVSIVDIPMV